MRNIIGLLLAAIGIVNVYAQCSSTPIKEAVRNGDFEAGYLTGSGASHTYTAGSSFDFQSDLNFVGNYVTTPCNTSMGNKYGVAREEVNPACGGPNAQFGNGYVLPGSFTDHTPGKGGKGFALLADFEAFSGTGTSGTGKPAAWKQLVDIYPNQKYYFSAWFANYNRDAGGALYNNSTLRFMVIPVNASGTLVTAERVQVGTANPTGGVMNWQQFYGEWAPVNNYTKAWLYIEVDQATGTNMNDLAIDDISFINGCQNLASLPSSLVPNLGADQNLCTTNGNIVLNSNVATGGTTQYFWYKDSGPSVSTLVTASSSQNTYTVSDTGTYRVCVQNSSFPGSCSASSKVKVSNTMPTPNLPDQTICSTPNVTLDAGVSGPTISYAWTVPATVTNPGNVKSFSTSTAGTYSVTVSSTLAACSPKSDNAIISSNLATASLVSANCSTDPASFNLSASGGAGTSYAWYTASTGGTQVGTGSPFSISYAKSALPITLYVENFTTSSAGLATSTANDNSAGSSARTENVFSVSSNITLKSVQIKGDFCSGNITINLQQNGSNIPGASITVPCASTWTTVPLNFSIPAGNNYKLVATTGSWLSTRNSFSSTSYGPITMTGNTFGSGAFFDWQITSGSPCIRSSVSLLCPAPVEFLYFYAKESDQGTILNWATSMEKDNKRFEIEKSIDGIIFYKIGQVNVSDANKNVNTYYSFTDYGVEIQTAYYRIKQIDLDGTESYSKVASASANSSFKIYPNPANKKVFIESRSVATLQILNQDGKLIKPINVEIGQNAIDIPELENGLYFVQLITDGTVFNKKLVVGQ